MRKGFQNLTLTTHIEDKRRETNDLPNDIVCSEIDITAQIQKEMNKPQMCMWGVVHKEMSKSEVKCQKSQYM